MNRYAIIIRETRKGIDIRIWYPQEDYPPDFKKIGTIQAENYLAAVQELKRRLIHAITEEWVSL